MSADITAYIDLIPTQNRAKPNFIAVLTSILQPLADTMQTIASMPGLFDVDAAVGQQEDFVGQWVGQSREIAIPLTGVYFSFDTDSVGFDQGVWKGPFDSNEGITTLPDGAYRTLLKAKIGANYWNGTPPAANAVWNTLFAGTGIKILTQDNDDMTMTVYMQFSQPVDILTQALYKNGYLQLRPAGVGIRGYYMNSEPDTPIFGFDTENSSISGFDVGSWAELSGPELGISFILGISMLG